MGSASSPLCICWKLFIAFSADVSDLCHPCGGQRGRSTNLFLHVCWCMLIISL